MHSTVSDSMDFKEDEYLGSLSLLEKDSDFGTFWHLPTKGQLISKANCKAVNSSEKQTNEFVFTTMWRVFVRFLEEIEDTKNAFRN